MMILTTRTIGVLFTLALATGGGAAWTVHALMAPGDGAGTDYGLDTNGNGTFEWLVVEADLSLPEAGTWDVYADLSITKPPAYGSCDVGGGVPIPILEGSDVYGPIAWVYERYFFPAGRQTVRMAFPGTDLARAGVDGPYRVHAQLSLGGFPYGGIRAPEPYPSGAFLEWNYTTRPYAANDFEMPLRPASFTGAHADVAVDVDADGLADLLELTADVHVNVSAHYSLSGYLTHGAGSDVQMVAYGYRDFDLRIGDAQVFLRFRGDAIRQAGLDGPWNFTLTLYGPVEYPYLDAGGPPARDLRPGFVSYPEMLCGSTAAYRASEFDDTVEFLRYTGRFEEATPDADADGLHDALVVRAEVDVLLAATFDVEGVLRPEGGSTEVAHAIGQVGLPEGRQWVDFTFPGSQIRASGLDGPFEGTLSLTPTEWRIDPMTTYVTRSYRAADFDDDVTGPRGYWIDDLAAGTVGTSLAISVRIVRGNDLLTVVYEDVLEVTVTDSAGSIVGSFTARVYLPSGGSTQAFSFSVEKIVPGNYTIRAVLGPADRPVDTRDLMVTV